METTVFTLFSKKRIPREGFEQCVFKSLDEKISDRKRVEDFLRSVRLLAALSPGPLREKEAARIYRELERHVTQEQSRNRTSSEALREHVFRGCHPERAEGDFAVLFLPSSLQTLKLTEEFVALLFERTRGQLNEDSRRRFLDYLREKNETAHLLENNTFDWPRFEVMLGGFTRIQEKKAEAILAGVVGYLAKLVLKETGFLRIEKLFRDTYREFRERFDFLEEAAPRVLRVLPEDFLEQERIAILPKAKLEEEVRSRTERLEYTLGELKEEKQKLAHALEKLKMIDRAKGDFISVVSHQFRTPLSVIRWSTESLFEEISKLVPKESDRFRRPLANIYAKSIFLISILEDVYDMLAIEGGTIRLEQKPNQLWEIVSDVMRDLEKEAKQHYVTVGFDRRGAPLDEISLDRMKIGRVVEILLRNAVQYTPEGGTVSIRIASATLHTKPALACSITDTGIGITQEDIARIFTKFFRTKEAIKKVPDGAGIGLYLVKHYIEAHRGTITVESEPGEGTTFTFTLPRS